MILSDAQKQQFIDDGYLHVPVIVGPDVAAQVKRDLLHLLGIIEGDPATYTADKAVSHDPDALRATEPARTETLESVAEQLVGPDFLRGVMFSPFLEWRGQTPLVRPGFIPVLAFPAPPPSDPPAFEMPGGFHIDGGEYVITYPTTNFLAVMVYLSEVPPWGGATAIFPGSHRQVFEYWRAHPDTAGKGVPPVGLAPAIPVAARAGDAVFMHYLTVHSGSRNFASHIRVGLNTAILPHAGKPYRPRSGPPQADWTPLDYTLRTDTLGG